jgi:hypothetical protein
MSGLGSTLYKLTWKEWTTPSGPVRFRLRASVPRTSGTGSSGWPAPTATDAAVLAGWGTPTSSEPGGTGEQYLARCEGKTGNTFPSMLTHQVALANGPARLTASGELLTGSYAGMESGGQLRPAHSRWLMGLPRAWDECAPKFLPKSRKK